MVTVNELTILCIGRRLCRAVDLDETGVRKVFVAQSPFIEYCRVELDDELRERIGNDGEQFDFGRARPF